MIAKRIPKKSSIKGSFSALAKYIMAKDTQPRISNCLFEDDFKEALYEIEAIQEMNTRTKADKTYHLLNRFNLI